MIRFLVILTALLAAQQSGAQSTEDSVKAVINLLFDAMKKSDPEQLQALFTGNAIMQTFGQSKEGKVEVQDEKPASFAASVARAKPGSLDERIRFEKIFIDGPLASVWTPYQFYYDGKFSHCGVNSFQLVRLEGEWKIQYIIDTRRRTGCAE